MLNCSFICHVLCLFAVVVNAQPESAGPEDGQDAGAQHALPNSDERLSRLRGLEDRDAAVTGGLLLASEALDVGDRTSAVEAVYIASAIATTESQLASILGYVEADQRRKDIIIQSASLLYPKCDSELRARIIDLMVDVAINGDGKVFGDAAVRTMLSLLGEDGRNGHDQLLAIVENTPHRQVADVCAAYLVHSATEADLPGLRMVFEAAANKAPPQTHPSIRILAHLGDASVLNTVDRLLTEASLTDKQRERLANRRNMIVLQNPPNFPQAILEEIRTGNVFGLVSLDWVVDRACARGVDKAAIQDALEVRLANEDIGREKLPWRFVRQRLVEVLEKHQVLTGQEIDQRIPPAEPIGISNVRD